MRASPIYLPAHRTRLEVSLSLEHERRNRVAHVLARNLYQGFIAGEAASQHAGQRGGARDFEYLLKLGLDVFALEEDEILHRLPHQQTCVARQQDAPVLPRQRHKFVIGEAVGVEDIESGDTKPFREAPEHDVGDKHWLRIGGMPK